MTTPLSNASLTCHPSSGKSFFSTTSTPSSFERRGTSSSRRLLSSHAHSAKNHCPSSTSAASLRLVQSVISELSSANWFRMSVRHPSCRALRSSISAASSHSTWNSTILDYAFNSTSTTKTTQWSPPWYSALRVRSQMNGSFQSSARLP
jgi:hypothetical protein